MSDAGEYSCRVGDAGDKESKATLTVEGNGRREFLQNPNNDNHFAFLHMCTDTKWFNMVMVQSINPWCVQIYKQVV